jgi:hypothetical protein
MHVEEIFELILIRIAYEYVRRHHPFHVSAFGASNAIHNPLSICTWRGLSNLFGTGALAFQRGQTFRLLFEVLFGHFLWHTRWKTRFSFNQASLSFSVWAELQDHIIRRLRAWPHSLHYGLNKSR